MNIVDLLITNAYADTAAPSAATSQQGGGLSFILMIVIFFLFIYFAVWRPQSKRAKEQRDLMTSLAKGDEVVTTAGIYGRISNMTDNYITLSVANNVDILIQKTSVVSVLPKGTLQAIE